MSYFVLVCGKGVEGLDLGEGHLVRADQAQAYVLRVVAQLDAESGPFYLWDDGESGTSNDLVCEAEEYLVDGRDIQTSSLGRLLLSSRKATVSVYVWWAENKPVTLADLPRAKTAEAALSLATT